MAEKPRTNLGAPRGVVESLHFHVVLQQSFNGAPATAVETLHDFLDKRSFTDIRTLFN